MEALQMLSHAATTLGVPIAIVLFLNEKRKERREREYGTYHALDEKYLQYLELCVEHPELDLYYLPLSAPKELTPAQQIKQYALFEILVTLMERAYLMYRDQSSDIKRRQFEGWNMYMTDWSRRKNFRALWQILGHQFDTEFTSHMATAMASTRELE